MNGKYHFKQAQILNRLLLCKIGNQVLGVERMNGGPCPCRMIACAYMAITTIICHHPPLYPFHMKGHLQTSRPHAPIGKESRAPPERMRGLSVYARVYGSH